MKPWHLMSALAVLLASGLAAAAAGPDELLMSRTAQVLGSGGSGRYQLEVTVRLEAGANVAAGLTALTVEETLPTGWVYENVVSNPAPSGVNALPGDTSQFVWAMPPSLSTPFTFAYRLDYPSNASGATIVGKALYRTGGGQLESNTVTTAQNAISCLTMTRSVVVHDPGREVTVQITLDNFCGEPVTALAVEESWPPGWTYVSSAGAGLQDGNNAPSPDDEDTFQFFWVSIPSFPYTFSYVVRAPESAAGRTTITGQSIVRLSGPELRTPLRNSVFDEPRPTPAIPVAGSYGILFVLAAVLALLALGRLKRASRRQT